MLIASHVTPMESEGKKLPIFQYYSYNLESNESASTGLNSLNTKPILSTSTEKLTKATAPTAASVLISFNTGSSATTTSLSNTLGKTLAKDVGDGQQTPGDALVLRSHSEGEKRRYAMRVKLPQKPRCAESAPGLPPRTASR